MDDDDVGTLVDGDFVNIDDDDVQKIKNKCYQTISQGKGLF